jgi:hypothetical protein
MRIGFCLLGCFVSPFIAQAQTRELISLPAVHLTEFASSPIQRARALAIDPDGGFYVVDNAQAVALRFSPEGKPVRRYGSRGDGPGELRGAGHVAIIDDSLIAVADVRRRDVTLFSRADGRVISRVSIPGTPSAVHGGGGQIWVGALNPATRMAAARIVISNASVEALVPLPRIYTAEVPITLLHPDVHVIPVGANVVVAFSAANSLAIGPNYAGDTIALPVKRRRGVPADLIEQMVRAGGSNPNDVYSLSSALIGLAPLGTGKVIAFHLDATLPRGVTFPQPAGAPNPFRYKLFASVVILASRRVCADIPIPIAGDESPSVAVRGGTIYVLDQDSTSDEPWLIRQFRINESACTWE